ncbi:hypothetical protein FRB95_003615 [Tulasnella sp. JGI-2019a]|nr:hypothetical protein FRB95_003615 [Tulasnella sp. JGI-2019a]
MYHVIADRRRIYNSGFPIHQLPQELMSHTLALVIRPLPTDPQFAGINYMRRLQKLSSVSSAWARLIKDTLSLWTKVSNNLPLSLLQQVLRRSKDSLLDRELIHGGRTSTDLFVPRVFDHIRRWRSVGMGVESVESPMTHILRFAPAPALKSLHIICDDGDRSVMNIFQGETNRLRHV